MLRGRLMKFRLQQFGIVLMAISIGFVVVSCSGDKVSQCAGMIKIVNQAVTETKTITADGTNGGIPIIEKLVGIFEKAANDMESINVADEKLKPFKSQFVTMYKNATSNNKELVISIKEKKLTKVNEGLKKSGDIFSPEQDLTKSLTEYCKVPKK